MNTVPEVADFAFARRQLDKPPYWSGEKILSWEAAFPRDCRDFVTHSYWTETGSVNVFRVVGTEHSDYIGKTWLQLLTGGKRMRINLQYLKDNPGYYRQLGERNPRIYYNTVDGVDFYVGADGNHRTCLARFFLFEEEKSQLHDVTINHYRIDEVFLDVYRRLQRLIVEQGLRIRITSDCRAIGREDTSGWKLDRYEPFLLWDDLTRNTPLRLDLQAAREKLDELERASESLPQRLRRLFGGNR